MVATADLSQRLDIPGRAERCHLALTITRLLEQWGLDPADQLMLLGLSNTGRSTLSRYRRGEPVSANRDMIERIGHLLGIHKSLDTLFPEQPEAQRVWISSRKKSLQRRTPVEYVEAEGITGLRQLRSMAEAQMGW